MDLNIYTYICIYIYTYVHTHTHTLYTYAPTSLRGSRFCESPYRPVYIYLYMYIHIYIYSYIYTHTHTYTYIHTHIPMHQHPCGVVNFAGAFVDVQCDVWLVLCLYVMAVCECDGQLLSQKKNQTYMPANKYEKRGI